MCWYGLQNKREKKKKKEKMKSQRCKDMTQAPRRDSESKTSNHTWELMEGRSDHQGVTSEFMEDIPPNPLQTLQMGPHYS